MAGIADDLRAVAHLAVDSSGPPTFDGFAEQRDGTAVGRIGILHRLERRHHLTIVVAIRNGVNIPAVGRPLIHQLVIVGILGVDDAADQRVIDARVVVRDHEAETLANLQSESLSLHFLGVAFGERKFSFKNENFGRSNRRTHNIPKCGFAGRHGSAHTRRSAVHVVGDVYAFCVTRKRADSPALGLREQRVVFKAGILQQVLQSAGTAAEPERVHWQHGDPRIDSVSLVAGRFKLARHSLPHDHPQTVTGRDAVPAGQHELIAVGMLWATVVVAQPA